jgi:hypothetical protein
MDHSCRHLIALDTDVDRVEIAVEHCTERARADFARASSDR